ncbi:MAG: NAD(P)-binding domain-containing protein [Alistipes sp.]|nr:NAD(P)-binding domain-containing protein [Alistipes sp.]
MKIAIIGAGNMGGAIACGLAASEEYKAGEIVCSNPSCGKLEALKSRYEVIATTTDNISAAEDADMVIVAVKPWIAEGVVKQILGAFNSPQKMLVSVVADTSFATLRDWVSQSECQPAIFRVIPNTAISVGESMTFVSADGATQEQIDAVMGIFNKMGEAMLVDEKMLGRS